CAHDPVVSAPSVDPSRDIPATSRTPHIVVATSDVQSHAATATVRAIRSDGQQRLAKRAQAREGSRCDRLVLFWDCGSAPPAGRLGRPWRSDKVACRPTTPPEN